MMKKVSVITATGGRGSSTVGRKINQGKHTLIEEEGSDS